MTYTAIRKIDRTPQSSFTFKSQGKEEVEHLEIHGVFTYLDGIKCPATGVIITDEDGHEVFDIHVAGRNIQDLQHGSEFRFVDLNGDTHIDSWSVTPGTGCSMSFPLHLVGEPPDL